MLCIGCNTDYSQWIVFHHGDTVVRAFYVDALEAFVTGRLVLALVDIWVSKDETKAKCDESVFPSGK